MSERVSIHGMWSSRLAFVLAAAGSAIGLGNIWKFPYITGENGGGAFVLVYLLCVAVVGLPVMMSEILIGRRGRESPINTMHHLVAEAQRPRLWVLLGWSGVVAGILIMSYYSVIAGWAMAYVFKTASGTLTGQTAEGIASIFGGFVASPEKLLAWHTIFMVMNTIVVSRGVRSGLEQAVRFMMPALLVLLLVMVGYAYNTPSFERGLEFLFTPDFSKISTGGVLTAMGHAFFTLSLGMGAIMMYGSYLPKGTSIAATSIAIALMDTLVALLAGMAIFPLVFANNLVPSAGPGLIFQTLPIAFGHMPYGSLFGSLFFILLVFAAWTSGISLIEPAVAWLVENRSMSRVKAATGVGILTWFVGIATVLSFSEWAFSFNFFGEMKSSGVFDVLDILTANFMLPLGGLAMAVFASRCMSRASVVDELDMGDGILFRAWYVLTRHVTPVAVGIVFLHGLGIVQPVIEFVRGLF
ncbi:MAG: sodium-dependent transporter [Gammaproteobacteria bacterium]|nr:sodium-dependent transporter [Gammaproteobacteria bacterium]MBU1655824.1 sodium-dependent transporter [Gammaproteobacteria bacterium]MBU1960214.1 sodium-dependent transporter [Gammaproteobacteria bacterium]